MTALLGAVTCQEGKAKPLTVCGGSAWEGAGLGGRMWAGSATPVKQNPTTTPAWLRWGPASGTGVMGTDQTDDTPKGTARQDELTKPQQVQDARRAAPSLRRSAFLERLYQKNGKTNVFVYKNECVCVRVRVEYLLLLKSNPLCVETADSACQGLQWR